MKTWQGLNAEEIASIPNDEYRLQNVERILRERNELRELSDAEIQSISHKYHYTYNPDYIGFARAILKKASEK
jgi:chromosome segregation and condensation protein ScpB